MNPYYTRRRKNVGERQRSDFEEEAAVDFGSLRRQHGRREPQVASGQVPLCGPGEQSRIRVSAGVICYHADD